MRANQEAKLSWQEERTWDERNKRREEERRGMKRSEVKQEIARDIESKNRCENERPSARSPARPSARPPGTDRAKCAREPRKHDIRTELHSDWPKNSTYWTVHSEFGLSENGEQNGAAACKQLGAMKWNTTQHNRTEHNQIKSERCGHRIISKNKGWLLRI